MLDPRSLYGENVFATLKNTTAGICHLDLTLNQLWRAVSYYYGVTQLDELKKRVLESLVNSTQKDSRLRIDIFPKEREDLFKGKYDQEDLQFRVTESRITGKRKNVKLKTSILIRSKELELVKTSNYTESFFLKRKAINEGYDDILTLDFKGLIGESSTSNIILKKDSTWFTPKSNIYKGVTRSRILSQCCETDIQFEDLELYSEAYLINSIESAVPVESINEMFYFKNESIKELAL